MTCLGCGTPLTVPPRGKRKWCSEKCRQRTVYSGVCIDCGGRTEGTASGTARAVVRCARCARAHEHANRRWTPEAIIAALRRFAQETGEPPTVSKWLRDRPADRPSLKPINREFGSWNAALQAGGFSQQRGRQGGGRCLS
jgi:hypothetical protein